MRISTTFCDFEGLRGRFRWGSTVQEQWDRFEGEADHTLEIVAFEIEFRVSQGKRVSALMCVCVPGFEELGFRVWSLAQLPSSIGVGNGRFNLMKEGPTLKPISSKLGTCQGRDFVTLALPNHVLKPMVFKRVWHAQKVN